MSQLQGIGVQVVDKSREVPPSVEGAAKTSSAELIERLSRLCAAKGLVGLSSHLADVAALAAPDLAQVEGELAKVASGPGVLQRGANHLLALSGKRLRPLCVSLAAKLGRGSSAEVRSLAVAVELVHTATLLHDDVIDFGEVRRGVQTARVVYGDAVSIYAGDWLLVDALRRVERLRLPDLLSELLQMLAQMLEAESLQLENRGRLTMTEATYTQIVDGKTASLFSYAMYAGARAGGVAMADCTALKRFGSHVGVAFQIADDLLDYVGNPDRTGKTLFADLREGKMTLPLIVAMKREPHLLPLLDELLQNPADRSPPKWLLSQIGQLIEDSQSIVSCRRIAEERVNAALLELETLDDCAARRSLALIAYAAIDREV